MFGQPAEPKLKNRFVFYVTGIPSFLIFSTSLPSFSDGEVTMSHINTYKKFRSGRRTWNDVTISLYDPIAPSGQQAIFEWAQLQHEDVTGRSGYSDFYKRDCTISILGPAGDEVGEWLLKGAFIKETDFGDLNYESPEEVVKLNLTLAYDNGILNY